MKLRRTLLIDKFLESRRREPWPHAELGGIGEDWIEHDTALKLGRESGLPLTEFLRGIEVYYEPKPEPRAKTQEYIDLMARLKREEEEREYRIMIGATDSKDVISIQDATKEVKEQLTTILNVMVSIVAVAWAFWYWCSSWQLGARTLMSLFAAIIVAVAEVVVYMGYQRRLNMAKISKRQKREHADEKCELNVASANPGSISTSIGAPSISTAVSKQKKRYASPSVGKHEAIH